MVGNYPVITLCGSTRFKDAFMEAQKRLTLEGNIVISVGLFGHPGDQEVWDGMDEGAITIEKSSGIKVTISKRTDGQIAVRSSSNPNYTVIIPPDLFCSEIGV